MAPEKAMSSPPPSSSAEQTQKQTLPATAHSPHLPSCPSIRLGGGRWQEIAQTFPLPGPSPLKARTSGYGVKRVAWSLSLIKAIFLLGQGSADEEQRNCCR